MKATRRIADEMETFFEALSDAAFCFDIAHAHSIDPSMDIAGELLNRFRSQLRHVHLSQVTVPARFAGLEGYLLSKCVALRTRAATKDYYDLAYVLLHNLARGPEHAAQRLLDGGLADALGALRTTFLEVRADARARRQATRYTPAAQSNASSGVPSKAPEGKNDGS